MPKLPTRIHHVLPDMPGQDLMETLCNRLVKPERDAEKPGFLRFTTVPAGNLIQVVFDPRDVSCNTCQHVWRNIRGLSR